MVVYVDQLNFESSECYEREMKEHNAWLLSLKSRDTEENPEQSHEPEPAKMETPDGNTQNISTPSSQNISPPPIYLQAKLTECKSSNQKVTLK